MRPWRLHDGYVLRSYLGALGVTLLLLTALVVVADLGARLDRISRSEKVLRAAGETPIVAVLEYYATLLPFLWWRMLPIAALIGLQTTLVGFDPLGPVTTVVNAMRAEVDAFTTELAPTALLAPVLTLYDELAGTIGAFDPNGLLEPVLGVLGALEQIIDRGIDEVIDSLAKLKAACESEGGAIPGLDLSVAASVDVGGGFGL